MDQKISELSAASAAVGTQEIPVNTAGATEKLTVNQIATYVGVTKASSSAPASLDLHEDTDNGTNKITITAPSAVASDKVLTLPDATDTLVGKNTTDTLTNKTLSTGTKLDANADENITQYGMARQAIMNGNFDVWQRGTSVALADVTQIFLADRWSDYVDKNGGTLPTLTRSRQLLTSGDIPNAFYFTRLTTNGAGTSLGVSSQHQMRQKIENGVRNLCGLDKKVTVSFYARSDIANKRICTSLEVNYGTTGSPSTTEMILGTPITLTSTWTKYTATFTTNTLVGKTFGTDANDYLQLKIYTMWGTTTGNAQVQASVTAETFVGSGNIDIAQVQLCSGDVALPFQPKSFGEELRACQRYYEKSYNYSNAPGSAVNDGLFLGICQAIATGNGVRWPISIQPRFIVEKRTKPTIRLWTVGGTLGQWQMGGADRATTAGSDNHATGFWVFNNTGGSITPNLAEFHGHWDADAEL